MSEEVAKLERDNTMVATAKEGEAFLETKGGVDEDAKTRAQQKEIEDITSTEDELKRTTTMAETAKEGKELLDGEELGKTRSQTKAEKNGEAEESKAPEENGKHEEEGATNGKEAEVENGANGEQTEEVQEDDEKAALKRTRTMEDTLKEGEEFLKKKKVENDTEEAKNDAEEIKA